MRCIGARLSAPLASWNASTSAWIIGQAKKTARNRTLGASSRYGISVACVGAARVEELPLGCGGAAPE